MVIAVRITADMQGWLMITGVICRTAETVRLIRGFSSTITIEKGSIIAIQPLLGSQ
jgi:hypothetical protein